MPAVAVVGRTPEEQRVYVLLELGMSLDAAVPLAVVPDVAHDAADLIGRGCPPDVAARILAPLRVLDGHPG